MPRAARKTRDSSPARKHSRSVRPSGASAPARDRPPVAIVPGSVPEPEVGIVLPRIERPRMQAVCRQCGRILEIPLELSDLRVLADFARRAPEGWQVEGLSFTLAGACRRCREGLAVRPRSRGAAAP
jgi:hypothetical protein